jgi:hypothetical protein
MLTPDSIIQELMTIRQRSEKGVSLLAEAERKHLELSLEAEKIELKALLEAQGTVVDRQAISKLAAQDARLQAELAKIELNRYKSQLKQLSESMMAVMAAGKMVEVTYKTAGVGER